MPKKAPATTRTRQAESKNGTQKRAAPSAKAPPASTGMDTLQKAADSSSQVKGNLRMSNIANNPKLSAGRTASNKSAKPKSASPSDGKEAALEPMGVDLMGSEYTLENDLEPVGRGRANGMLAGEEEYRLLGDSIVAYCGMIEEMIATLNQKEVAISNWKNLVMGISAAQVALGVASSAVGIAASIVTFGAATPILMGLAIWGLSAGVASQAAKAGLQNARASDEEKEEGFFAKTFKGLMKKDTRNKGGAISGTKGTAKALSIFGEGEAANMVGTVAGPAGAILGTAMSSKTIIDMRKINPKEVYQKLKFAELQKDLVLLAVELKKNYMQSAGRFNDRLYILLEHKIKTTNDTLNKYKG